LCAKSRMRGNETPGHIVTNFCTGVGVHDVITSAIFYDCRLWGLSMVGGKSLGFFVDLHHRPYNTLTLPCECVIINIYSCVAVSDCYWFIMCYLCFDVLIAAAKIPCRRTRTRSRTHHAADSGKSSVV